MKLSFEPLKKPLKISFKRLFHDKKQTSFNLYLVSKYTLRITGFKATKDGTTEETPQENSVVMLNPVWASSGSEETYYSNMAVVKNARMSSAMKGQLEDVRRVDVLINNLKKNKINKSFRSVLFCFN